MAASGLGALGGAAYLASRHSVVGLGRLIAASAALAGASLIAFAGSRTLWWSGMLLVSSGFWFMVHAAATNTILQTIVDDDKRGRVMSLFVMAFMGTMPLGSLLAGHLVEVMGASNTVLLAGVLCLAGAAVFARALPTIGTVTE